MAILAYGALNPDLVHYVDGLPAPGDDIRSHSWALTWGGKAANSAVALSRWGMAVRLSGLVVGTDALGNALIEALSGTGVDLSLVIRSASGPTRHCVVLVDPSGDRTMVCTGYEGARWADINSADLAGIDVVLLDGFSGEHGASVASAAAAVAIPVVWLDCPSRYTDLAHMVVWSRHEHPPEEAARSEALLTILTAGSDTIRAWGPGGELRVDPPPVAVVDSTGAGDVFAAACARGVSLGWETERILRWAAKAGAALVARGRGAGMPTLAEVDAVAG